MGVIETLLLTTAIAGVVGTGLGGLIGAILQKDSNRTVSLLLSFAGGVMLSVVCFDLVTEAIETNVGIFVVIGAIALGVARPAGAEFSFFLAIPTMLGASALKVLKYAMDILDGEAAMPVTTEILTLVVGCVVSLVVSLLVIKGLMEYVRKRSFSVFGVYRIVLGILVIGYFLVKTLI